MPVSETRSFRDSDRSTDDARNRSRMRSGQFDRYVTGNLKIYRVREGKNLIRILPAQWEKPDWQDDKHYGVDIWMHYQVGIDNQSYLCLNKHKKGACPICEAAVEAQRDGSDDKTVRDLKPKHRVLAWIIDRLNPDEGPQLWGIPFSVDQDIGMLAQDEDTKDVILYDKLKTGRDIRFYLEKTGKAFPEYPAAKMRLMPESRLHDDKDIMAEWVGFTADNKIPEILNFYSYEHILAVYNGQAQPKRGGDDDEDEKPRGRSAKSNGGDVDEDEKPSQGRRRQVDDDDADERPQRTRIRARPAVDDDDNGNDGTTSRTHTASHAADDDDDKGAKTGSARIRENLKARGTARRKPADDDELPFDVDE